MDSITITGNGIISIIREDTLLRITSSTPIKCVTEDNQLTISTKPNFGNFSFGNVNIVGNSNNVNSFNCNSFSFKSFNSFNNFNGSNNFRANSIFIDGVEYVKSDNNNNKTTNNDKEDDEYKLVWEFSFPANGEENRFLSPKTSFPTKISNVTISGSAEVTLGNQILDNTVNIQISGSGSLKLPCKSDYESLFLQLSGSGSINGNTSCSNHIRASVSGSGSISKLTASMSQI
jgi:hypothetical protein